MLKQFRLKKTPQRILLIALRHLGDVLLCTPLITTLRHAYPNAAIDVLVYKNTQSILEENPDITSIIGVSAKPSKSEYLALTKKIGFAYDLSISTQTGDRPFIYCLLASTQRISLVPERSQKGWWKRYFFNGWDEFDDINTHTVLQLLRLADTLSIKKKFSLTPPGNQCTSPLSITQKYAVLHLFPLWKYKRWHLSGWKECVEYLSSKNVQIVLTAGPNPQEIKYVNEFSNQLSSEVINLAGKTSLAELSSVITHATLYIGPDTGATHLASATGTPTIAIFGPTNPVKWAPWPINYHLAKNPFTRKGHQTINNVHLIQGPGECVPCHLEGCDRHRESYSACLDNLSPEALINTIHKILHS